MRQLRDHPLQLLLLVDLGTGTTDGPDAGFQEISNVGMEVTVAEYRNGNEKENSVRKITGLNKATDVTLKRGIIGSLNLYQWLNQIRNGDQGALRTVVIQLQNEDHTAVVQEWMLMRARVFMDHRWPHLLCFLFGIVGVLAILFGATGLATGIHGRVGGFFRHMRRRLHLHF